MSDTIIKIDMDSPEFQDELEKTKKFTEKVLNQFNWVYNPQMEITEGIWLGLTRNKLIHNKRYCPCFFVTGNKEEDRICPCKPAIEHEVPNDGHCHCQIFCTAEYAAEQQQDDEIEEVVHQHSRGLSADECKHLLSKEQFDGDEIMALLEARELGMVDFIIMDVREQMEWRMGHIKGADVLVPTSSFFNTLNDALEKGIIDKSKPIILYCHVGSRSAHCQMILQDMQFEHVGNLTHGIVSYGGEIVR